MATHPLDPLDEHEFRHTAAILRRDEELGGSWRFAAIELLEPDKAAVKAWRPGDPIPRAAFAVLWNRADNQTWEGVVDLTGDRVVSWTARRRRHPQLHRRRVPRGRRRDARSPRRDRRPGRAWHHRPVAGADRGVDLRQGADAGEVPRPAARLVRHLVPRDPRRQPVRPPGVRPEGRRRHEHPGAARARERPRPRSAGRQRGVRPRPVDGRAAHRPQTARGHPARGRLVHRRRHRAEVAELDDAARLQPPRGSGHLPGHVRRPRHDPRHRLPDVVRRDGGPLPRRVVRPLPAYGVRHR